MFCIVDAQKVKKTCIRNAIFDIRKQSRNYFVLGITVGGTDSNSYPIGKDTTTKRSQYWIFRLKNYN